MLSVEIFDTITGAPVLEVPAQEAPYTTRVTGAGSCRYVFPARSLGFTPARVDAVFRERANTIAVCDGADVLYAGPIMRTVVDDDAGTVACDTSEFRVWARWRMTAGVDTPWKGDLFLTGKSASGAVRAIIERGTLWSARWKQPIDLPADGVGSIDVSSNWYDHDYIEDLLQEVEQQGYEVMFRPYKTAAGWLRFETLVAPMILTGMTDLPRSVMSSALTGLRRTRDATRLATGVLGLGQGSGSDMILGFAGDQGAGDLPISDITRSAMGADTVAKTNAMALEEAKTYGYPIEQWSFQVALNEGAEPLRHQHVSLGRRLAIDVRGHWAIPDGVYKHRVIALKGGLTGAVTLEVQRYG